VAPSNWIQCRWCAWAIPPLLERGQYKGESGYRALEDHVSERHRDKWEEINSLEHQYLLDQGCCVQDQDAVLGAAEVSLSHPDSAIAHALACSERAAPQQPQPTEAT
jgi:hypothetical protein